jgi:phenylpropionate dioxygenase-like ring-hydroxylating dioxygenase large terminal subunit
MQSLLSRQHYYAQHIFAMEQDRLFRRLWILAAIRPMVAQHLQYRTLDIAGTPVIVQNFNGKLRAFENICRHRLSRIHADEFGAGPLLCPYHHWSYAANGALQSVPRNSTLFQFTPAQLGAVRLREFCVAEIGGLIFVNLSDSPPPISQQFEPGLIKMLTETTGRMDEEYIYTRFPCRFNWKTGIENIKDPLHVQCLHRESYPENFDERPVLAQVRPMNHEDLLVDWSATRLQDASMWGDIRIADASRHPWHELVETLESAGAYRRIHLFPNVNLMIIDGRSFAIQIYSPTAPEETEMQMAVALTRSTSPIEYKPAVLWEHLKSDMAVLSEDIACLEAIQPNFRVARQDCVHGAYERWILDFHSVYLCQLSEAN